MRILRFLPLCLLAACANNAKFEKADGVFVDGYLGPSWTNDSKIETTIPGTGAVDTEPSYDRTPVWGGRVGYWFGGEGTPVGIAVDGSSYMADGQGSNDVQITPISLLMMLRAPLIQSDDYPAGRLQPYVGVGPSVGIVRASYNLGFGQTFRDSDTPVGLDARGGLTFLITPNFGIFGEYRYNQFRADWRETIIGTGPVRVDSTLASQQALFGVTFRF